MRFQGTKKILIAKMRYTGDVLLSTPFIRAIRKAFPGAHFPQYEHILGPAMMNYDKFMRKVGETFDPLHISNPPRMAPTRKMKIKGETE